MTSNLRICDSFDVEISVDHMVFNMKEFANNLSIRVYVVDDDPIVRDFTVSLLLTFGWNACGIGSGRDFLDAVPSLKPGVVLLAVRMADMDGIAVIESFPPDLRKYFPMVMITGHGDLPTAVRAMKLGAKDFLQKPVDEEELLNALQLHASGADVDEKRWLLHERSTRALRSLTPRERDVLNLLASGMTNKDVARDLGISYRTVEMHRARMFRRLGVSNLIQAIRMSLYVGIDEHRPMTVLGDENVTTGKTRRDPHERSVIPPMFPFRRSH